MVSFLGMGRLGMGWLGVARQSVALGLLALAAICVRRVVWCDRCSADHNCAAADLCRTAANRRRPAGDHTAADCRRATTLCRSHAAASSRCAVAPCRRSAAALDRRADRRRGTAADRRAAAAPAGRRRGAAAANFCTAGLRPGDRATRPGVRKDRTNVFCTRIYRRRLCRVPREGICELPPWELRLPRPAWASPLCRGRMGPRTRRLA